MRKIFSFLTAILFAGSMMATDYELVTSASQLQAGAKYVIGTATGKFMSTTNNASNRRITDGTITENVVEGTETMMVFTLGGETNAWTFATDNYLGTAGYLNATNSTGSNYLKVVADLDDYAYFTIDIADGVTTVTCNGKTSRNILYLNGTTCFACYNAQSSAQYIKPNLYKEVSDTPTPLTTVKTVYCKNEQAWWLADGATVGVYAFADGDVKNAAWPGVRMTAVEGETNLWKADIDTAKYEKIIFVRVNGTGDIADWGAQTEDLAVPADKDLYTITSTSAQWSGEGNKVTGTWSVYKAGGDPVVDEPAVIKLHGNFTGDWANTAAFTLSEDKKTATLKLTLNKGNYEFGMRIGADDNWTSNGVAFTRENKSAAVAAGTGNLTLAADTKGDYTFTWTYATNTLAIEFPEYVETLPVMQIAGAWDVKDEAWVKNDMTAAEDKKTASYEVELKAGDYEFKVIKDGAWLTKANEGNAYGLHREWTGVANVKDEATENLKLTADVDGKYTFVWTFANDSLGVIFPEKPAELQAVSAATTWDFSKITANTGNALYNKEGIQLTDESTPSKNDEMVYANYTADFMTFAEGFDAATMAFKGEYPIRKNQYCQAGTLHFKTTVAGTITVKFSDTGSSASAIIPMRAQSTGVPAIRQAFAAPGISSSRARIG